MPKNFPNVTVGSLSESTNDKKACKTSAKTLRVGYDSVAIFAHVATLVVFGATQPLPSDDFAKVSTYLLVAMEGIALAFHIFYLAAFYNYAKFSIPVEGINRAKWIEYGVTATCGSIAVLLSEGATGTPQETALIVAVSVMGGVQQGQGDLIEQHAEALSYGFVTGSLLQVAEFAAVLLVVGADWLTLQYLVLYSCFGLLCLASAVRTSGLFSNPVYVECLYSLLGWVTKVAIFWTFVAKKSDSGLEYVPPICAAVSLIVGGYVASKAC